MSNVYAPFGLHYIQRQDGAQPNYAIQTKPIFYTDSSTIGYGDPVQTQSSGVNQGYLHLAGTNTQMAGVFIGCYYTDSVLGYVERPSWTQPSTAVIGTVVGKYIPDSDAVFEIQVGNLTTPVTQTSIGLNAAFGTTNGVPNKAGFSTAYLDGSTIATTSTLPLRILGYSTGFFNGAQNDPTSANPVLIVAMNNSDANSSTGV
jgi:hypothetical protein